MTRTRTGGWVGMVAVVMGWLSATAQGSLFVGFDKQVYQPGERFAVQVKLDADDTAADRQDESHRVWDDLPYGLFSLAISVQIEGSGARVGGIQDVQLAEDLNDDGTGRPAMIQVTEGFIKIRGALKPSAGDFYHGNPLMTLFLTDPPSRDEPYTLSLHLLKSSPREQVFIDGLGNVLDDQITFGTATVGMIPEPASLSMLMGAVACRLARRRRLASYRS